LPSRHLPGHERTRLTRKASLYTLVAHSSLSTSFAQASIPRNHINRPTLLGSAVDAIIAQGIEWPGSLSTLPDRRTSRSRSSCQWRQIPRHRGSAGRDAAKMEIYTCILWLVPHSDGAQVAGLHPRRWREVGGRKPLIVGHDFYVMRYEFFNICFKLHDTRETPHS